MNAACLSGGVVEIVGQVVSIRNVVERELERVGVFAVEAKGSGSDSSVLCASHLGLVLHLLLGSFPCWRRYLKYPVSSSPAVTGLQKAPLQTGLSP